MDGCGPEEPGTGEPAAAEENELHQLCAGGNLCPGKHRTRRWDNGQNLRRTRHDADRRRPLEHRSKVYGCPAAGQGLHPAADQRGAAVSEGIQRVQPGGDSDPAHGGHDQGHSGDGGVGGAHGRRGRCAGREERNGHHAELEGTAGKRTGRCPPERTAAPDDQREGAVCRDKPRHAAVRRGGRAEKYSLYGPGTDQKGIQPGRDRCNAPADRRG